MLQMFHKLFRKFNIRKNNKRRNNKLILADKSNNNKFEYLSPDINTPITAILLCNSVILDCIDSNNFEEIKEIIRRQSISCDFLKLTSRKTLDSFNMTTDKQLLPNIQSTNIVDIANKSIMMFKCVDTKRKYILNMSKNIPKYILTDPRWIADIILNLLLNSKKFTNDKGGVISINIKTENSNIYVHVIDNGIGIPEEFESKLFTVFSKNGDNSCSGISSGISLYMMKKKILILGGKVGFVSKYTGSHFWFCVPLRETLSNVKDLHNENNKYILPIPLLKIFKICVLEQEEITLKVTKKIIEKTSLNFDIYDNIDTLCNFIKNGKYYDIIILSYNSINPNIYLLNRVLRKHLPYIYKVLNLSSRLKRDGFLESNDLVIENPLTKNKLAYCMNEFLIKKRWINVLIVEDDTIIQTIFKHILTKIGFIVTIASNGKEGLAKLIDNSYFIVFSDINLPVMNGLEMLKEYNKHVKLNKPYISIITAQNHLIKDIHYDELADELNSKPFGYNDFIGTIERAIKSRIVKI